MCTILPHVAFRHTMGNVA